ncbi:SDR family NAD(P)-dependent oxidoreductase [Cellulomonas fimi]|uniref:SDR family NAD(P)-dependent oxidoreductase n=1 Tax=Cellulomonas fimi TaxID=1708 RepID=UPI0018D565D3
MGRATAHALAAASWDRRPRHRRGQRQGAAHDIAKCTGVQALSLGCDVTDEASVQNELTAVADALPPVGALVNNAGITSPVPFVEVSG